MGELRLRRSWEEGREGKLQDPIEVLPGGEHVQPSDSVPVKMLDSGTRLHGALSDHPLQAGCGRGKELVVAPGLEEAGLPGTNKLLLGKKAWGTSCAAALLAQAVSRA